MCHLYGTNMSLYCYDSAVCRSYDGGEIWLHSSVGRPLGRYAEVRFLLRSVVILSRWTDVGCETYPSLTFILLRFITESSFFFRRIHLGYYQLQIILNLIILNVTMIHQHFIHSIIFLFHHHQIYLMNYVHQNDVQLFKHLQTIPLQLFHHQQIIVHIHLLVLMMDFVVHQIHLILQFQVEIIIYYHPIDNHI
jgi:hypothetical protein